MGIREEVAAIERQSAAIAQAGEEIEAEGAAHWERYDLMQAREDWEADQNAIAEYEQWFIQKTIMEADAETVGEVNG
jgi:hypothetical protein